MVMGLGTVSDEELLDILNNVAYHSILQQYRNENYEFLTQNEYIFTMPPLHEEYVHVNFSKNSCNGELEQADAPVTFEQIAELIKKHWELLRHTLYRKVIDFVAEYSLDLTLPKPNRPANYIVNPNHTYTIENRIANNEVLHKKLVTVTRGLRAALTGEGYSPKKIVSIFAGKYINWLGREDSEYLYAKVGKNVGAEAFNLLQRDKLAFKYYMENEKTKNWTIAVALAVGGKRYMSHARLDSPGDFASKYEDHKNTVRGLIEYAKHHWLSLCPYLEDKVFQNLSPRLIKDTYHRYPKQLHRFVALVAENGIDIPTYTMSKMLIYKEQNLHSSTIDIASALSHAATLDRRTTQKDAWEQFKSIISIRANLNYGHEYPEYVPLLPNEDRYRDLEQLIF